MRTEIRFPKSPKYMKEKTGVQPVTHWTEGGKKSGKRILLIVWNYLK